jgi:CspA family cold shock protein
MNKPPRITATVKFYNEQKGYGFLTLVDGRDLFVHASQIVEHEPLQSGQRVSCIEDRGTKGPIARQVVRI